MCIFVCFISPNYLYILSVNQISVVTECLLYNCWVAYFYIAMLNCLEESDVFIFQNATNLMNSFLVIKHIMQYFKYEWRETSNGKTKETIKGPHVKMGNLFFFLKRVIILFIRRELLHPFVHGLIELLLQGLCGHETTVSIQNFLSS